MAEDAEKTQLEPSGYVEHQVPHIRQRYSWDCGVTCVMMVLARAQREELRTRLHEIAEEEGFGYNTWTIDLCYLLKRYGIEHCMYTTMVGVNEDHSKLGYYKTLDVERERVSQRFSLAASRGIRVGWGSPRLPSLLRHLTAGGPLILLVDHSLLVCKLCGHNSISVHFRGCLGHSYLGHYIVVTGFCSRRGLVLYRDPALRAPLCAAKPRVLLAAATATGTDCDTIMVYKTFR